MVQSRLYLEAAVAGVFVITAALLRGPRSSGGGWLTNVAKSFAALVSTPGFRRKPRSRNQSM